MKIYERLEKIAELETIEVPYKVKCAFGENIRLFGSNIAFTDDTDFVSLEDAKIAVAWLVEQLGGTVKWSKK